MNKPVKASKSKGAWTVTFQNGDIIKHVFAKDNEDALKRVTNTPEYHYIYGKKVNKTQNTEIERDYFDDMWDDRLNR